MLVLGTRDTLLMGMGLAVKIGKKVGSSKWESSIWKGWCDNALHDPLQNFGLTYSRLHCSPPEDQGPHDRLT